MAWSIFESKQPRILRAIQLSRSCCATIGKHPNRSYLGKLTNLYRHRRSAPGAWRRAKTRRSESKSGSRRWSHWDEIGWVHYPEIGWSHSDEIRCGPITRRNGRKPEPPATLVNEHRLKLVDARTGYRRRNPLCRRPPAPGTDRSHVAVAHWLRRRAPPRPVRPRLLRLARPTFACCPR
jgi:hypothetical protein